MSLLYASKSLDFTNSYDGNYYNYTIIFLHGIIIIPVDYSMQVKINIGYDAVI